MLYQHYNKSSVLLFSKAANSYILDDHQHLDHNLQPIVYSQSSDTFLGSVSNQPGNVGYQIRFVTLGDAGIAFHDWLVEKDAVSKCQQAPSLRGKMKRSD